MRILHVETGRHLYGGALQVKYLLEGLAATGVENLLVCPRGSEIAKAAAPFARICPVPMGGEFDPRLFFHLLRVIRREHPDLLHAHSRRGADLWGGVAARFCRLDALNTRRVDNPEPAVLAKLKYGLYQRVVTISEGIRRVLLDEGVPPGRLDCIPSAVDTSVYRPGGERAWFVDEFGMAPGGRAVGVIAQLIPRKGHRYLIEAAPEILRQCPEVQFIFFGQGPIREELAALCRERGIDSRVVFAGFRRDLPRILPCLDLVVHPALMEGLGVSLLQASACAVPIVAAAAGGIPEVVQSGVNGLLVEPANSRALVDAVLKVLQSPEQALAFGETGRNLVVRRFSIDAMVNRYLQTYRELLPSAENAE